MTAALRYVNDRLEAAARAGCEVTFFCECGYCLAENVSLLLEDYEDVRAREDFILARGHDSPEVACHPRLAVKAIPAASVDWATIDWRTFATAPSGVARVSRRSIDGRGRGPRGARATATRRPRATRRDVAPRSLKN
jgi:hypothetical protein